jgi:hypothetical protein
MPLVSDGSIIRDDGPLERVGRFARERLEIAFPPTLFGHAFMPSRLTTKVWGDLLRRTPFIGLGWSKLGPKPGTPMTMFVGDCAWSAYLVVRNPAGQEARFFGDERGPGLLKMTRAAIAVLHGAKIPNVGTLQVTDAGNAYPDTYDDENMSMAAVDFCCNVGITVRNTLEIRPEDLAEIDITWSFAGLPDTLVDSNSMGAT